jgi:hypothetical protein
MSNGRLRSAIAKTCSAHFFQQAQSPRETPHAAQFGHVVMCGDIRRECPVARIQTHNAPYDLVDVQAHAPGSLWRLVGLWFGSLYGRGVPGYVGARNRIGIRHRLDTCRWYAKYIVLVRILGNDVATQAVATRGAPYARAAP